MFCLPFKYETVTHLFCECARVSQLWSQLRIFFSTDTDLPLLTPQTAIFGSREKDFVDISK